MIGPLDFTMRATAEKTTRQNGGVLLAESNARDAVTGLAVAIGTASGKAVMNREAVAWLADMYGFTVAEKPFTEDKGAS